MDDVLQKADDLGKAIREHKAFKDFVVAQEQLAEDEQANQDLQAYNQKAQELQQKEQQAQPVAPEEKQELEKLRQTVAANDMVKDFMEAQTNYTELMRQVNERIYGQLQDEEKQANEPPAGEGQGRIIT